MAPLVQLEFKNSIILAFKFTANCIVLKLILLSLWHGSMSFINSFIASYESAQ